MHPDDDNQWLFGRHLAHGGLLGWIGGWDVNKNQLKVPMSEPKSFIRLSKMPMDFLLIHAIIS
jgi:hypothetical protein